MTKQELSVQSLIQTLEGCVNIDMSQPIKDADSFRKYALEATIEHNQKMIQMHLSEVAEMLRIKLPYIQELTQLNAQLRQRIEEIQKEGERPPVPTETRSPKAR